MVGEYVALHCFEFQRFGDIRVWVARAGRARVGGLTRPWHRERERERERKKSLIHHRRGGPSGRPKSPWGRELHVKINSSNVNPGMFD